MATKLQVKSPATPKKHAPRAPKAVPMRNSYVQVGNRTYKVQSKSAEIALKAIK